MNARSTLAIITAALLLAMVAVISNLAALQHIEGQRIQKSRRRQQQARPAEHLPPSWLDTVEGISPRH